jgi:hypothetical protein
VGLPEQTNLRPRLGSEDDHSYPGHFGLLS